MLWLPLYLSSVEGSRNPISGFQSTDSKARSACYIIILQTKVTDNKSIIDYLIKDTNSYNILFEFRNIKQEIMQDEFIDIAQLLLHDRFAQIRIFALELLYSFMPEEVITILEKSLFDNNQSVQDLLRYLFSNKKINASDADTIYRIFKRATYHVNLVKEQ